MRYGAGGRPATTGDAPTPSAAWLTLNGLGGTPSSAGSARRGRCSVARHGSRGRYNQGCRCGACSDANAWAARARRDRLRQESAAEPGFRTASGRLVHPPARPASLSPLQERSVDAAAKAAAVRGGSEAAQRRRERLEAESLAADLLDREDRLRPADRRTGARSAGLGGVAATRRPAYTPPYFLPPLAPGERLGFWRLIAIAWGLAPPITPAAIAAPALAPVAPPSLEEIESYCHDLRRFISGQGPPPVRF